MRLFAKLILFASIFVIAFSSSPVAASDSDELITAFSQMSKPVLDTTTTLDVNALILQHQDLSITLDSGRIAFFKPITIDSDQVFYGAYCDGPGRFNFVPPVDMEKEQLNRFFGVDSLDRSFKSTLLFFSSTVYEQIIESCPPSTNLFSKEQLGQAKDMTDFVTKDENVTFIAKALRGAVVPSQHPFLFVSLELDKGGRIYYLFDPHVREEVRLLKEYKEMAFSAMETVCQYSQYIDETYTNINGLCKECIEIYRYNIEASISSGADFEAMADVTFEVKVGPTQILPMTLHEELRVDSIKDSAGEQVDFARWEEDKHKSWGMWVFFDRPLTSGETVTLRFFYNGDVVERELGEFYVNAGAGWYPRYGYNQRALFTLKFRTDKHFEFVATGNKVGEEIDGNTLITTWKVRPPTPNVSFNIGNFKKYTFEEEDVSPVNVYFSDKLHKDMAELQAAAGSIIGKDMQKQVAEDIINAIRLFSHHFGPYPHPQMSVSEVLALHGEAFPGFLHLGFTTWLNTDTWGHDRIFRAHEVAHQWWGVGIGWETYHDQWLSEGLAEYSALIYLQAVAGNDQFLDRLKDYRDEIFSARKYLFTTGEESGPIALGTRTSSTKTKGDFDLVIYKKGAYVMHMLRNMMIDLPTMNEDAFYTMLKEYYGANRGANVRTSDFKRLVEKYTGIDMTWFFDQWIYSSDLPSYEFSYNVEPDTAGGYIARGKIITTGVPEDFKMFVPLEIEVDKGSKVYVRLFVDTTDYEFTLPSLPSRPKKLRLNPFESVLAKVKQ